MLTADTARPYCQRQDQVDLCGYILTEVGRDLSDLITDREKRNMF